MRRRHNARHDKGGDTAQEWRTVKEPGVGTGNGKGSREVLHMNKTTVFACAACGFFVFWWDASSGRDAIAPGDGCASKTCGAYQKGRFVRRQLSRLRGVADGSLRLVDPPRYAREATETILGESRRRAAVERVAGMLDDLM